MKDAEASVQLLRDIESERKVLPESSSLKNFETRAWSLINRGIEIRKLDFSDQKDKRITCFNRELQKISRVKLPDGKATTLAKRIEKHDKDLARYLEESGVEYPINRAEQQLRPLVVARKNSYGWSALLDNPDVSREEFVEMVLEEELATSSLQYLDKRRIPHRPWQTPAEIRVAGVPSGIWQMYRERYAWEL